MNNEPVIVKLISGDMFIATYIEDSTNSYVFDNPITIKIVSAMGESGLVEKTMMVPFCALTEDTRYTIKHDHVLFMKALHSNIKLHYTKMIEALSKESDEASLGLDDLEEDDTIMMSGSKTIH